MKIIINVYETIFWNLFHLERTILKYIFKHIFMHSFCTEPIFIIHEVLINKVLVKWIIFVIFNKSEFTQRCVLKQPKMRKTARSSCRPFLKHGWILPTKDSPESSLPKGQNKSSILILYREKCFRGYKVKTVNKNYLCTYWDTEYFIFKNDSLWSIKSFTWTNYKNQPIVPQTIIK